MYEKGSLGQMHNQWHRTKLTFCQQKLSSNLFPCDDQKSNAIFILGYLYHLCHYYCNTPFIWTFNSILKEENIRISIIKGLKNPVEKEIANTAALTKSGQKEIVS